MVVINRDNCSISVVVIAGVFPEVFLSEAGGLPDHVSCLIFYTDTFKPDRESKKNLANQCLMGYLDAPVFAGFPLT